MIFCLLLPFAAAGTIGGHMYDFELNSLENVKVSINTIPQQVMVANEGYYSFNVPKGDYIIRAEYFDEGMIKFFSEETFSIIDEGQYVLDLILMRDIEDEMGLFEENENIKIDTDIYSNGFSSYWYLGLIVLLLGALFLGFRFFKLKYPVKIEDEFDDDLKKVLAIIKKEDGRITQKEIRKRLGVSEAKISLMITELEHKEKVQRIKKGRGNVIILE
ncbi:MAG: winged helix-turn-helix transcriptional regulator [Nanoarchaeota archaeon]|nr:winged helix-turn-helix transcriptional regulator [Nanoarchaeota archaeon]